MLDMVLADLEIFQLALVAMPWDIFLISMFKYRRCIVILEMTTSDGARHCGESVMCLDNRRRGDRSCGSDGHPPVLRLEERTEYHTLIV
jgi:hypothetical protein